MSSLAKHYRCYYLEYDLLVVAVVVAVVAVVAVWVEWFGGRDDVTSALQGNRGAVYGALVSIFGSLLGFTLATMTIIVSWVSREQFENLRRFSAYPQLWLTFHSGIAWLGIAAGVSVVAILADRDTSPRPWVWYVVGAASLSSVTRVYRCVSILRTLIDCVVPPIPPTA